MQDPAAQTLKWKEYSGGRLLMAAAILGYFEMEPGNRFRHVQPGSNGLHTTDLGPCTHGTLDSCKAKCEDYQRQLKATLHG